MTDTLFRRLHEYAKEPLKANPSDAAFDLYSVMTHRVSVGASVPVGTGIAIQLPPFHCAMVLPRSGLACKSGVTIANSPGLIDSGYRGEIVVYLRNEGDSVFYVKPGDRIAQLLIVGLPAARLVEATELSESDRGTGGFGSSGK